MTAAGALIPCAALAVGVPTPGPHAAQSVHRQAVPRTARHLPPKGPVHAKERESAGTQPSLVGMVTVSQ